MKCDVYKQYKKSIFFTVVSLSILISVYILTNDDILYDTNTTSPLLNDENNTIGFNITKLNLI